MLSDHASSPVRHVPPQSKPDKSAPQKSLNLHPVQIIIAAIAIYAAAYIITQLLGAIFVSVYISSQHVTTESLEKSTLVQAALSMLFYGAIAMLVYVFVKGRQLSLRSIGWLRPRPRDAGYALIAMVAYLIVAVAVSQVIKAFVPGLDLDQKQEIGFDSVVSVSGLILAFVSVVILPPLIEELLARGLLYTGLRSRLPVRLSVLITSIMFAAPHLQLGIGNPPLWTAAIDTFVLSLFLCYLREKTGSLWPGIFLHATKNGVAFIAIFVLHMS